MKRAGIYIRVSTEEQALHGYSLAAQRNACIKKAKEMGAETILEFADEGFSGATLERPGLNRLREVVKERMIDMVVIYDPDRFSRKLSQQLLITEEFDKAGVELVFCNFDWVDSPEGRLFYSIKGAIAEYERELIRERMMRGKTQKALQGGIPGSVLHFGYNYDPETETISINEREAEIVRYIFKSLVEDHKSISRIALELTEAGIPTKKKVGHWYRQVVKQILNNPVYKGEWVYKGIKIPVPAIIDEGTWDKAQRRLEEIWRLTTNRGKHKYLLSGLLTCADCGMTMCGIQASYWGRIYHGYTCHKPKADKEKGCRPMKVLNAESLDMIVWEKVKNVLRNPSEIISEIQKNMPEREKVLEEIDDVEQKIKEIEKGRESLIEALSLGLLELDDKTKKKLMDLKTKKEKLILRLNELKNSLRAFEYSSYNFAQLYKLTDEIFAEMDEWDFEDKRKLILNTVYRVVVRGRCDRYNNRPGQLPGVEVTLVFRAEDLVIKNNDMEEAEK